MSGTESSARGCGSATEAPLSFTVHSMPSPTFDDERRTASGRLKMLALLAVCAAPVLASYFAYFVVRPESRNNYGDLVDPPREMPQALPLATLAGDPVAAASLRGQWLLVVVAQAGCDAACEQNLYLQRQLRETLGRDKDRVDKVWFVVDEAKPRPEVIEGISFGGPARVLRVPREELAKWLAPAAGRALGDHLYIVDPMGRWMMRMPPDPDPSKFKRDIERLLRASVSWDRPGR